MEVKNSVNEDAQTKDLASKNGDDADEFLKKTSEVVKDESSPTKTTEDIKKSSEKDLLNKIEEINDENPESSKVSKDNSAASCSESVVVDELIMDINVDLNTKKKIEKDLNTNKHIEKNANSDIGTKKIDCNLIQAGKKIIEEDKVSPVNIGNHVKSNIKKSIEIKENIEEIEKNKNNLIILPKNIESISMDTNVLSNNVEQMEVDTVEKNDMEVDSVDKNDMEVDGPGLSQKTDTVIQNSLQEKDNVKLPDTSKPEVSNTNIDKPQNEKLIKEQNRKNVLSTENEIILQKTTDKIQPNNDLIKKNELTENGESVTIIAECSKKSDKEVLLTTGNNSNYSNSDDKLADKINIEKEATKVFSVNHGKQNEIQNETSEIRNSMEEKLEKTKVEDSLTETESCTISESDNKTSDGINKNVEICKNGMRDTTTDEEDEKSAKYFKNSEAIIKTDLPAFSASLGTKPDGSYEVNFLPEDNDIKYFSVEKVELQKTNSNLLEKTTSVSSDQSSCGSVSSLAPFTVPITTVSHLSEISSTTSTSGTQKIFVTPLQSTKNITHAFKNKIELCTFVIDHFTKIKNNIEAATSKNLNINVINKNINTPSVSPSFTSDKKTRKRSLNITQSEDESEDMSKAKQPKKNLPISKNDVANKDGECVLAKWSDRKYYAGRISEEKPGNKFVILFEDGASKILSKDAIVFGEDRVLPLKDQSVYALVDEDEFELGVVVAIEKLDDKVHYTVKTDNKTVKVTSSDIYLKESQAKIIQKAEIANKLVTGEITEELPMNAEPNNGRSTRNKRSLTSPVTPEAGFSGSAKNGNKRQKSRQAAAKIIPQRNRYESISEVSDTPDESPLSQMSPDVALEAIEGVQPEVQKTDSESEICKLIFLSDIKSLNPSIAVQNILGPLPETASIFRNKCFILTCTVGLKPHRYEHTNKFGENYRNRQFSNIPFVKVNLKKQLEAGGGKVYEHFEDIPKSKYRQCKLIAARPCLTAKYIQCLAADIQAISHEWIINCCTKNRLLDHKEYALPAGWSITKQIFVKWSSGKSNEKRESKRPFSHVYILLAAQQKDFIEYWNRVCKMTGAEVRLIKSLNDITPSTKGYMVADMDFPQVIRSKAEHFGIQIVSTVWIVESLILGKLCPTNSNRKLLETFQDDDL